MKRAPEDTGKEVVITDRSARRTDKKRNFQIAAGHSAWWHQMLGTRFVCSMETW